MTKEKQPAGFTQREGNPAAVKLKKLYIKGKKISANLNVPDSSEPDIYAENVIESTAKDISGDTLNFALQKLSAKKSRHFTPHEKQPVSLKSGEDNFSAYEGFRNTYAAESLRTESVASCPTSLPAEVKIYCLKGKSRGRVSLHADSYEKVPKTVKSRSSSFSFPDEAEKAVYERREQLRKSFHIKSVVKKNSLKISGGNDASSSKKVLVKSIPFMLTGLFFFIMIASFCMMFSSVYMSPYAVLYSAPAGTSVTEIIKEINDDFLSGISDAVSESGASSYKITGSKAVWQDMLCIYAAHCLFSSSSDDVNPKESLEKIFSDMNTITFEVHEDENGEDGGECVLLVHLSHLSLDDMASLYNFTDSEIKIMRELNSDKYLKMWADVIYTSGVENDIVSLAASQLGNTGGEPYWSWYGYTERVPWCAIFVSWCAYLCGYTDDGSCPKFENCSSGISWFVQNGRFEGNDYIPVRGDIVFFDWEGDGISDHVGIVEYVENDIVNTIEGNAGDMCCQKQYPVSSGMIAGYGIIRR